MKARSGPVAWLIYLSVRTLLAVMQAFPIEWNLVTARLLAAIWRRLTPRHLDRARAHLRASIGAHWTEEQIDRVAVQCLESWAMFAVEAICLPRLITRFTWSRWIRLVNFNEALNLFLDGRGAILVTGHYGSFEIIGHLLAALGFPVVAVMRPLDNVYLNRFLVRSRRMQGLTLLDKKGAMESAEEHLRSGALLGFIGDQDAGRKGLWVSFFDQLASTYKSIGLLAMSSQCPVIVGYARRHGRSAKYDVGVERIIYPHDWKNESDPLRAITQSYTAAIEQFVRTEPYQYLWIHRRWKTPPTKPAKTRLEEPAKHG